MAQNPKPHFPANFVVDQRRQGVGLGETAESLSLQPWLPIPFTQSFTNYDPAQYAPCYYTKDRLGFVHLRGLFLSLAGTAPAVSSVIFHLPRGFWPEREEIFNIHSSYGITRMDAMMNGDFQWVFIHIGTYAASSYHSLAGIHWHAPPQ